jgi:hypothetical protein
MGRGRGRGGKHSHQKKKNSIQDSVGNEENGYPVPELNKTTINVTEELSDAHKKKNIASKKKSGKNSQRNSLEKIFDMVNQNIQDALKKFEDTKNKEREMTQKQIKELREDLKFLN